MGWTKSVSKGAKGVGKSIDKGAKDTGKAVVDTGKDAGKAIEKGATDTIDTVVDTTTTVINVATDTYNYAVDFANDTAARTESIEATVLKNTEEMAKAGIDTTSKEFNDLSKQAEQQVIAGVEAVKDAAVDAYAWIDENACRIGLTASLSMGFVAAFTPAQPEGAATSTTMSSLYVTMISTAGKYATAIALAEASTELIYLIPGVKGQVNQDLLFNCVSNCIYYSLDSAALWGTPAGVGIAMGAAVSPIVATLICTRTLPNGFSKALPKS
ncbi:hypothetical protein V3O24_16455 [Methylobacter sp. Wu8]|uniref:hypothetical protein n=1 Tax=Methylobacter sp. Wu8 TaxID=3118457 RepID=UPI002F34AF0F